GKVPDGKSADAGPVQRIAGGRYGAGQPRSGVDDQPLCSGARAMKPCVKRCRSQRGLMLIELLLALAVTGMVAAAMSSMLWAVSYGTSSSKGLRALAVKTKTLQSRVGGAIRGAAVVLDAGEDFLVLWVDDGDGDGQPSLHEIQRID